MRCVPILALALLCGACETTREGTAPALDDVAMTAKQLRWFEVASYVRRCHGYSSPRGALWAAVASSLGGVYYLRNTPAASATNANARRAAVDLMKAGYRGRVGNFTPRNANCAQMVGALARVLARLPERSKNSLARVVGSLLRSDAPGRQALAQAVRPRGTIRRSYVRRAARARHAGLKPGEQQLPLE